ncbi:MULTISPECIES: hypothetical protein [unclassified Mesorhizobium]|uniref:hypothetical protein n=1 Tax=unclassified Mesorhizobium TaxID=325217 RepID=UPI000F761085|nr:MULTISPECIES: hypothetical protein [unclassified Mesorhizobium]AZO09420.1 hypothetical protein EJ074_09995 [Mesorhizobium sp. M3A.F.Ca.ET.080.04.2.1]RWE27256.1 MAG: hypothetical protein EOS41_03410 [Mesorhizobium sp.]RWE36241.1 MAG: hypothetical protein EOS77_05630 [Mesorhizobium sp.]RWF26288.1 MAG: hypothetical protein EOS64_01800 [Mesorhizobium sp.]
MGIENARQPCPSTVYKRDLFFQRCLSYPVHRQSPRECIDLGGQALGILAVVHRLQGERCALLHSLTGRLEFRGFAPDFRPNALEKASQASETPFIDCLMECDQRHLQASFRESLNGTRTVQDTNR